MNAKLHGLSISEQTQDSRGDEVVSANQKFPPGSVVTVPLQGALGAYML